MRSMSEAETSTGFPEWLATCLPQEVPPITPYADGSRKVNSALGIPLALLYIYLVNVVFLLIKMACYKEEKEAIPEEPAEPREEDLP